MKLFILAALSSCCFSSAFGQSSVTCGAVYEISDSMASYPGEITGLMKYFNEKQIPVLSNCMNRDFENGTIDRVTIVFTINSSGEVIDATFPRSNISKQCAQELKRSLLQMKGWAPGVVNGKKVCTYFRFPIACLLWE